MAIGNSFLMRHSAIPTNSDSEWSGIPFSFIAYRWISAKTQSGPYLDWSSYCSGRSTAGLNLDSSSNSSLDFEWLQRFQSDSAMNYCDCSD